MIKKLAVIGIALSLFLLTGCGVNIKQEGNKIYTDLSKDKVYNFAAAAVQDKGYTITKEDEQAYTFTAVPENNPTLSKVDADNKALQVAVTDGARSNETVATVLALINGNVDAVSSEQIAKDAVAEIIAELNKYGKFNSQKAAEYTYAIATTERVSDFIQEYINSRGLQSQKRGEAFGLRETAANNKFNEPLTAVIVLEADETNRLTVRINVSLQGNYDVHGNQAYVDSFVNDLLEYLDTYPVVEKGTRHTYRFIDFDKAFANARNAAAALGFTIKETDRTNYIFTAAKNKLNLAVTFTKIDTSIGVNAEAFIEGNAGESKQTLSDQVTEELSALVKQLASYQTILTSEKVYLSSNQNEVVRHVRDALTTVGYAYTYNAQEYAFNAVDRVDPNKAHYLLVNNLGTEGISVQINTLYNGKSAGAESIVRAENNKLLRALGSYDTLK